MKKRKTQKHGAEDAQNIRFTLVDDNSSGVMMSNQTGRLMIKFDDNEPEEVAKLYDKAAFEIKLQKQGDLIEFSSKHGNRFRLFVAEMEQPKEQNK